MEKKVSFFGLTDEPFRLTIDLDYFFPSESHKMAMELLKFSLKNGDGFALLTGMPGVGKTTVIKRFLQEIPPDWESCVIVSPMLKPNELISAILSDIKLESVGSANENLSILQNHLLNLAETDRKLILIIDEAQSLSVDSLEQIRLLSNIETDREKPLQIILSGQEELEKMVKKQIRQLNQRITVRCRLKPLNKVQTNEYIRYRTSKAGGAIFIKSSALRAVYKNSGGIPRVINSIMRMALTVSYSRGDKAIKRSSVADACSALDISGDRKIIAITTFLIAAVIFGIVITLGHLIANIGLKL